MQWLALWKSYTHYRHDSTVWSNNWKDFIVADSPELTYNSKQHMHLGRTPLGDHESGKSHWISYPPNYAAVMHFQFSVYNNFQLKQCWLRCSELIQEPGTEGAINAKYSITLLDQGVGLQEMPKEWYDGVPFPIVDNFDPEWNEDKFLRKDLLPGIMKYFDDYGTDYFKGLDIWHIPQLKSRL